MPWIAWARRWPFGSDATDQASRPRRTCGASPVRGPFLVDCPRHPEHPHAGLFSAARRHGGMDAGSIPACTIGVPNGTSFDHPRGTISADRGPRLCVRRIATRTGNAWYKLRGHEVLLVLGVLPESLPRLRQIETQRTDLARAGIRVILMATSRGTSLEDALAITDALRVAIVDSDTTKTYAIFACRLAISCVSSTPAHVEWLVDRGGYLRARWLGVPGTDVDRTAEIMADARQLQREPSRPPAQQEHGH